MKVEVDTGRCQAHGLCAMIAPAVFGLDDGGYVQLIDPTPGEDQREAVDEAVGCCPTEALAVIDT
ncbi:ferredoxin [Mycobacterium sp. E1747]|uniref:ferredoxin n=1 Tax=Mycobacterium sp. E1747 TaxID=1834128 RepID=UPI000801D717|nr:ferredoxin [Mycobacterium sp. E1747]OBH08730.1 ferredoxin [Mycobacterium sp. E1747]